jgi:ribonuclease-3
MRTLGDAVIRLVLVESLIAAGYETRGSISQRKSELEAEGCLASIARRIRLSTYVRFGAGERLQGAADNDYVLAESLEALIGAVYLDGGIIAASRVLKGLYADALR